MAILPELRLADVAAGAAQLIAQLGFVPQAPLADGRQHLILGSQHLLLASGGADGPGVLDHLALSVPDVDAALALVKSRGGALDREVTPDGPLEIAEFWDSGVRYVFVTGPEGARIELCAKRGTNAPWGGDHFGISCRDLKAMRSFFLNLGAREISNATLERDDGQTYVSFLSLGGSVLELYSQPDRRANLDQPCANSHWSRLVFVGDHASALLVSPEGVTVELLHSI